MVKRIVSGAHYGLKDWLVQRFTAVIILIYTLALLGWLIMQRPVEYDTWRALFGAAWMRYFTLLFAFSLLLHAWVGVRDILMDYVHPTRLRLPLQVATIVALLVYSMWAVNILWSVA
ncbi:MAG: succinate dehydrogenase, hydrophobic membrane anchor protein [Betaproteobacteria bacterium RBG_16_58_11]|nr:MAG: succinate dehydrogenase, hydrophobic membrane anchor protein [Betaproteobacteria bacterium RBG_16_58_11]